MTFITDGVGSRIAAHRRLTGLTAAQLSDRTGGAVSKSVLANIESGRKSDVSVHELLSLALALGVPPIALLLPLDEPDRSAELGDGSSVRVVDIVDWDATAVADQNPIDEASRDIRAGAGRARKRIRLLRRWAQLERRRVVGSSEDAAIVSELREVGAELEELGGSRPAELPKDHRFRPSTVDRLREEIRARGEAN